MLECVCVFFCVQSICANVTCVSATYFSPIDSVTCVSATYLTCSIVSGKQMK